MKTYTKEDMKVIKDNPLLNGQEKLLLDVMYRQDNIDQRVLFAAEESISKRSEIWPIR